MKGPIECIALFASVLLVLGGPTTASAAKGKKAACKGSKVAVKVGKKKTCRPFAKLFPKPKGGDLRLAYLQQALRFDPAKFLKGKKRKRARTLQSGFGAAGKRAQKKVLGLLPKALSFFDRKRAGASSSAFGPGPALASANCGVGAAGPRGTLGGGSSIGMLGENGMFIETDAGGGLRIRVTFFSCGGVDSFRVPECPTGAGDVQTPAATGDFSATTEVWRGNELVSRNSTRFEDQSKAKGKVGKDAKLKHIDVEHKQVVLIVVPGSVFRGVIERKVRIEMPGGNFDPDQATVLFSGDWLGDPGSKGFARTAKAAIDSFKEKEPRWSSFERKPFCAKADFTPASNTLKLKKGQSGPLTIRAKARDGSGAAEAVWTLIGQVNADFTPTSADAPAASVSYTVKDSSPDYIEVTAKFTSTAGVGEDKWRQPVEKSGTINEIAGTFSGRSILHVTQGDSVAEWSGNVTFERSSPAIFGGASGTYKFKSGFMSVTFSGNGAMTFSAPLCTQSGSKQLGFSEIGTNLFVIGTGADQVEPYEYSLAISSDNAPTPPMVQIVLSSCGEGSEELNDVTFDYPAAFGMTNGGVSPDGVTYAGSDSNLVSGSGTTENWSFTGTE